MTRRAQPLWAMSLVAVLGACHAPANIAVGSMTAGALHAQADRWTWIPVAAMQCAAGTSTGIGVNPAPALVSATGRHAARLVVYLAGGGACWDAETCYGNALGLGRRAVHFTDGYGYQDFARDQNLGSPLLQRQPFNPFRDDTLVFVPYCTGDVHIGDRETEYATAKGSRIAHHAGWRNLDVVLRGLRATNPAVKHVFLVGGSAGGLGAFLNLAHAREVFAGARVDIVDDSGPPVEPGLEEDDAHDGAPRNAGRDRWARWTEAWGPRTPDGCVGCRERLDAWVDFYDASYPDSRIAILSFNRDAIYSSYAALSGDALSTKLDALGARVAATRSQRLYLVDGFLHVVLASPIGRMKALDWIGQMVAESPDWQNVR